MSDTIVAATTEVVNVTLTEASGVFNFEFSRANVALPNPAPPSPTAYTVQVNLITSLANTMLDALEPDAATPVPIHSTRLDEKSIIFGFNNIGLTESASVGYRVRALVGATPVTSHDPEMMIPPPNG